MWCCLNQPSRSVSLHSRLPCPAFADRPRLLSLFLSFSLVSSKFLFLQTRHAAHIQQQNGASTSTGGSVGMGRTPASDLLSSHSKLTEHGRPQLQLHVSMVDRDVDVAAVGLWGHRQEPGDRLDPRPSFPCVGPSFPCVGQISRGGGSSYQMERGHEEADDLKDRRGRAGDVLEHQRLARNETAVHKGLEDLARVAVHVKRGTALLLGQQRREPVLPLLDAARERRLELLLVAVCARQVRVLSTSHGPRPRAG